MSIEDKILKLLLEPTRRYKGMSVSMFGIPTIFPYKKQSISNAIYKLNKDHYVLKKNDYLFLLSKGRKYIESKKIRFLTFDSPYKKESPKNLLVMFDIPEVKKAEREWFRYHLKKFDYERGVDDWSPLVFLEEDKDKLSWLEEGNKSKGSLVIMKGKEAGNNKWLTIPGGIRWESTSFKIKPGFGYKVTGWVKNSEYVERKYRSGFLRLDFYKNEVPLSITSRPIISFVSSRPFGESIWHKVEVQGFAPQGANFIKVGFQTDDSTVTVYLDEVELYETKEEIKEEKIERYQIPDEDFFRPSDSSFT